MDQVYSRLYGKSRSSASASPARHAVPPTAPTSRAPSAPVTHVHAPLSAPASASSSHTPAPTAEDEHDRREWEAWRQAAMALRADARRSPHGVELTVRTSLNVTQSVYAGAPPAAAFVTRLVRQCLDDFRAALLLGRDWAHHGLAVRDAEAGPNDTTSTGSPSPRTDNAAAGAAAGESAERRAARRIPQGLDEEANVLLLKLLQWDTTATSRAHATSTAAGAQQQQQQQAMQRPVTRATIDAELLAWFAAQAAENGTLSDSTGFGAASLLLSQQLRYKPLLADLCVLAQHVLAPLDVVRHQHRWLFVNEDVSVTLRQRLHHHRVVLRERAGVLAPRTDLSTTTTTTKSAAAAHKSASSPSSVMSAQAVQALWGELWATLGAAWRQRDRLLGGYARLHGARAKRPIAVPLGAHVQPAPASGAASPLTKERYERYAKRTNLAQAGTAAPPEEDGGVGEWLDGGCARPLAPPEYTSDADTCGFGPLTPDRIGISEDRCYVIRDALAAVMRSLTVEVRPSTADRNGGGADVVRSRAPSPRSLALSTASSPHTSRVGSAFFDSLVDAPGCSPDGGQRGALRPLTAPVMLQPPARFGFAQPSATPTSWLFDPTQEDVAALAAPYMSPEWYTYTQKLKQVHQQQQSQQLESTPRPGFLLSGGGSDMGGGEACAAAWSDAVCVTHCFSDDAWSVAVLTIEAALTGFDVTTSHLSVPGVASHGGPLTGQIFADVAAVLTAQRGVSCDAACNFLYATLHAFARVVAAFASHCQRQQLCGGGSDASVSTSATMATAEASGGEPGSHHLPVSFEAPPLTTSASSARATAPAPSPLRLAQEWLACMRAQYDDDFVASTVAEVCRTGLQWRRGARWLAFLDAHAHAGGAGGGNSPTTTVAGTADLEHQANASLSVLGGASTGPRDLAIATRATQRLQRGLDALQVPLLALFPGTVSDVVLSGAAKSSSSPSPPSQQQQQQQQQQQPSTSSPALGTSTRSWWAAPLLSSSVCRLQQWRSCVEARAGSVRSHGGDEGETAAFTAWVRLVRRALLLDCLGEMQAQRPARGTATERGRPQRHGAAPAKTEKSEEEKARDTEAAERTMASVRAGRVRYWITSHPFIHHLIASSQLTALRATTSVTSTLAELDAQDDDVLPRLARLFIPLHTLDRLLREEVYDGGAAAIGSITSSPTRTVAAEGTPESPVSHGGVPHPRRPLTGLESYLGDHWRLTLPQFTAAAAAVPATKSTHSAAPSDLVGPARRAAVARTQAESYYAIVTAAHGSRGGATHRAVVAEPIVRQAVETVLRPLDICLDAQFTRVATLRRLLLEWGATTAGATAPALSRSLRQYLMAEHAHCTTAAVGGCSAAYHVPIPATMRATCWAVLLQVPAARRRVKVFQSLPLFRAGTSDRQIALDVPRCHQYHPLLSTREGREKLFRVIKAWLCLAEEEDKDKTGAEEVRQYWQGVDSVSAVLLTVAYTDEPLAVFLLDRLLRRYVPHQEEEESGGGGGDAGVVIGSNSNNAASMVLSPVRPNSMADQLAQLEAIVAYADPLLAHHLFDRLECRTGLFAISWFLTLLAHNLPLGQVYPIWDFALLYMEDYPHCFVCLCCAVLLAHREVLLSQDPSACLATLSRLTLSSNTHALVVNAAVLMQTIPSSLRFSPALPVMVSGSSSSSNEQNWGRVGCLPVQALVQLVDRPLSAATASHHRVSGGTAGGPTGQEPPQTPSSACAFPFHIDWGDAGLFLIDLRPTPPAQVAPNGTRYREQLLGALPVPLAPPLAVEAASLDDALYSEGGLMGDVGVDGGDEDVEDSDGNDAVAAARRRLADHRRRAALDFQRRIEEAAAEVARQVQASGVAVATVPPRPRAADDDDDDHDSRQRNRDGDPDGALDALLPMTRKTMQEPHVVLVGSSSLPLPPRGRGAVAWTAAAADVAATTGWDVSGPLARQLVAFGVHKVSVLLGGFESIKREAPKLVVRVPEGTGV